MPTTQGLRHEVLELLAGHGAHLTLEEAVADFPDHAMNTRPPHVPYTPWQLLEHVRIAQHDILDYATNPAYVEPRWPDAYWPAPDATATPADFARTVDGLLADRQALHDLAVDAATDLEAVIQGTPGHTLLREIRLAADHTAYHVGEFAILRQVMGTWPAGREP